MSSTNSIPRFVITGGPCAGKTGALAYLRDKLLDIGFYPIMVPEAATLLISSGINPTSGIIDTAMFQEIILEQMLFAQQLAKKAARHLNHAKPVIIYDRGLMDIKAYMDNSLFETLQERHGLDTTDMRERSCDAVFHLRTAALGAEKFYTRENNLARTETMEMARELDERTLQAWVGHQHVSIIDNSTDFEGKLRRLFKAVCGSLGVPAPLEIERKFLLKEFDQNVFAEHGINAAIARIEQFYLTTPTGENPEAVRRVRKRTQYGSSIYWKTHKEHIAPGTNIEIENEITAGEYEWSRAYMTPNTEPILKNRNCFVFENQYFELDVFEGRHGDKCVLEIELSDCGQEVILPPFLKVDREVTDERGFSNRNLAQLPA